MVRSNDQPLGPSLIYAREGAWVRWDPSAGERPADLGDQAEPKAVPEVAPRPLEEGELALAAQFGMLDDGTALRAFSSSQGELVEVPAACLATLLAFETPREIHEGDERRNIEWARSHGFLLTPKRGAPVVSAPRIEPSSAPVSRRVRHAEPADDRMPVYLVTVPHPTYFPLALGMIRAYAERFEGGRLLERLRFVPFVTGGPKDIAAAFMQFGPGVWLMSDYMWSLDGNLAASSLIKSLSAKNITVHGGPSVPKYPGASDAFLQAHPQVDVLVYGEGEQTAIALLDALARAHQAHADPFAPGHLDEVDGLVFRARRDGERSVVRTGDRKRIEDLDALPSPYLNGVFDDIAEGMVAATLETNRGCPYGCTFCDWGSATLQKIRSFDEERVHAELRWIAAHKVPILWVADANFGIFDRDVALAKLVADIHQETGFPREFVVNYAKNATLRVAEIVRTLTRAGLTTQGIISIQTRDEQTLVTVRRSNIKTKRYEELSAAFQAEGLPLTVELMLGLPGSTLSSLQADLQHYFDESTPVRVYDTVVLPNSPMADPAYMREHAIEIDERGYVVASKSFTRDDLNLMDTVARLYRSAVDCCVLRHVLTFVQWDHGIRALDFLTALAVAIRTEPARYPLSTFLLDEFRRQGKMRGGWRPLFEEVERFAADQLGVPRSSAFTTVLRASELLLPEEGRELPATYHLDHDLVAYTRERGARRLETFGPGTLDVSDPDDLVARLRLKARPAEFMQHFWELSSPLARVRAKAHFIATRGAA